MARRIVDEGFPLTIWARRVESLAPFADTAAAAASSPAELAAASDVVCLCVVADADVEEVLERPDGVLAGMAHGGTVLVHSTVHPETCRRAAAHAAERGIAVVDAPVSGGGMAAAQRRLLVMVGGEPEHVDRCRPVLETYADPIVHVGPLGSGQAAKLVNNLVFTAQITLALESFEFARRLDVDRAALAEVLAHGSGGSQAAALIAATHFDIEGLRQARSLLRKDVGIIAQYAQTCGAGEPTHLVNLARQTLRTLDT
jgi:3-hydroxyisobutyrate dehydrogenase